MSTLTLELDDRHTTALEALAAEQDMSKAQVLRQALRLYQMVHERAKDGQDMAFTKDGRLVPMLIPTMLPLLVPAPRKESFDHARFTDALYRAMDARGVTQKQVAESTGVSETTISRMRAGRHPDAASLAALSAWAGINPARYVSTTP
jgi:predicted transcriptional regulator